MTPRDEEVSRFTYAFPDTVLFVFYSMHTPKDIPSSPFIVAFKFSNGSDRA